MPGRRRSGGADSSRSCARSCAEIQAIAPPGCSRTSSCSPRRRAPHVRLADGREVLNLCANNYLGLADHPAVVAAAREALDRWGYGLASVRFICGTAGDPSSSSSERLSEFLGTEDTILYGSLLRRQRRPVRDAAGRGGRGHLGRAQPRLDHRRRPAVQGAAPALRQQRHGRARAAACSEAAGARRILIATDGVFSMDGYLARLDAICELADRYGALVMVDDCHAVGFARPARAAARPSHYGVAERVDIVTGTLGKALGGASGGYTSGRRRDRPLVAPALPPVPVLQLRRRRRSSPRRSRSSSCSRRATSCASSCTPMRRRSAAGSTRPACEILPGAHPIVPVMYGEAAVAVGEAERLLAAGVYVIAFSYPVVPEGRARIRVQLSAAHSPADVELAAAAFAAGQR